MEAMVSIPLFSPNEEGELGRHQSRCSIIMLNIKIVHITEALYYGMPFQFLVDSV